MLCIKALFFFNFLLTLNSNLQETNLLSAAAAQGFFIILTAI